MEMKREMGRKEGREGKREGEGREGERENFGRFFLSVVGPNLSPVFSNIRIKRPRADNVRLAW